MKKRTLYLGIAVILTAAMALSACKEEEPEYGSLTINNLPSVPMNPSYYGQQVYWGGNIYYDEDIKSLNQLDYWTSHGNTVAWFQEPGGLISPTSPFSLYDPRKGELDAGFLDSGTFLVYIWPAANDSSLLRQYESYMSVTFNKGKATIDFNDMTRANTLPDYYTYR